MSIGLDWQEEAKRKSVGDYSTQKIIDSIDDELTRNIKGKKFTDATRNLSAFAVADQKIVYMPKWVENYLAPYEFQWIVFHEVGHIINNHKFTNLQFEFVADEYAVRLQWRIGFGICALIKISEREMRWKGERVIHVADGEIQIRINRLLGLGLPW